MGFEKLRSEGGRNQAVKARLVKIKSRVPHNLNFAHSKHLTRVAAMSRGSLLSFYAKVINELSGPFSYHRICLRKHCPEPVQSGESQSGRGQTNVVNRLIHKCC